MGKWRNLKHRIQRSVVAVAALLGMLFCMAPAAVPAQAAPPGEAVRVIIEMTAAPTLKSAGVKAQGEQTAAWMAVGRGITSPRALRTAR